MWTALGMMIAIWIVMRWVSSRYLTAVDAIAERAQKNRDDVSSIDRFRSELKGRREPEVLGVISGPGGSTILWLMMFKLF